MLTFFHKIRQTLLSENKLSRYLLYAIGEITLVMVGILLAVQVNNWNESRESKQRLNGILRTISYDLVTDTTLTAQITAFYEQHEQNSLKIINKELTPQNFESCLQCPSLPVLIRTLTIQQKGYELLKNFYNQHDSERDSLVTNITQFYALFTEIVQNNNDNLEADALRNLEHYKEYSWFVDFTQSKKNPEMTTYFTQSEDFRKMVAAHGILAHGNYLAVLRSYKLNATAILEQLTARLEKEAL